MPDFDAVPTFLALAEQDINLDLRARCMVVRATQLADGQYVPLPCDYLEGDSVRLMDGRELLYAPRGQMANLRALQVHGYYSAGGPLYGAGGPYPYGGPPGGPRYFDVVGDLMELWPYEAPPDPPPPDLHPYVVEMAYFRRQTLGPLDTDTTDVLIKLPRHLPVWLAGPGGAVPAR